MTETRYRITIPNWHPVRINTLLSTHHMRRSKLKRIDGNLIQAYSLGIPRAKTKRRIKMTITLGPKQRGGDVDAYWKSVLDAMVSLRLLVDDSRKWCQLDPVEFMRGDAKATTIELFEEGQE